MVEGENMGRPAGVVVVAVLTLLASLVIGFFILVSILLLFVGINSVPVNALAVIILWILPYIVLTLFGFLISILLFVNASRFVYYSAMVFWVLLSGLFLIGGLSTWIHLGSLLESIRGAFWYEGVLQILNSIVPLVYSVGCLAYFSSSKVRKYFRVMSS
jgi:hypothetical protein